MGCEQRRIPDAGRVGLPPEEARAIASPDGAAGSSLQVLLPPGWLLRASAGCRLRVVCGTLWLTDARGQDLWLAAGACEALNEQAVAEAMTPALVQLTLPEGAWPGIHRLELATEASRRRVVVGRAFRSRLMRTLVTALAPSPGAACMPRE